MTKRPLLHSGTYTLGLVASISVATALSGASCSDPPKTTDTSSTSSSSSSGMGGEGGGASSSTGGMGVGGEGGFNPGVCPCTDFPADPVFLDGLTPDVHTAITGTPPTMELGCISEPAPDAMVPRNWTPLLIEFSPALGQNVYQVKLEVDNQVNPLVVYTTKYSYTMPTAMWTSLTSHSAGHDVKISVTTMKWENGAIVEGPYSAAPSTLHIAPIDAPGSVVYWGHNPGNNEITIRGFTVGDLTPKVVLSNAVAGTNSGGKVTGCMSCHSSSPDGKFMFYTTDDPPAYYRCVDARQVADAMKPTTADISDSAYKLLGRHRQMAPIFSEAHFSANDSVAITTYVGDNSVNTELIWTDLHATDLNGWGTLARNGDTGHPTSADWSHDGKDIVYVTSPGGHEGVIAETTAQDRTMDIMVIPYNNRMGGDAVKLPGASDPQKREFYPVYSPSDTWIVFNRSDTANSSYDQATAELFVVPRAGGTPTRLNANDPPVCTGYKSPGITNSWAGWSPQAPVFGGLRYYWLVFSSKRRIAAGNLPQLYIAAMVTKMENGVETIVGNYPAAYAGSQLVTEGNHGPVWDNFVVDQIPK